MRNVRLHASRLSLLPTQCSLKTWRGYYLVLPNDLREPSKPKLDRLQPGSLMRDGDSRVLASLSTLLDLVGSVSRPCDEPQTST